MIESMPLRGWCCEGVSDGRILGRIVVNVGSRVENFGYWNSMDGREFHVIEGAGIWIYKQA